MGFAANGVTMAGCRATCCCSCRICRRRSCTSLSVSLPLCPSSRVTRTSTSRSEFDEESELRNESLSSLERRMWRLDVVLDDLASFPEPTLRMRQRRVFFLDRLSAHEFSDASESSLLISSSSSVVSDSWWDPRLRDFVSLRWILASCCFSLRRSVLLTFFSAVVSFV